MHLKSANQNSKLKTLVGSQKKMMAILAHDTRAPLFSIKQTLEMCLKNKFRKEDYPEIFELLTKDSAHALAIVEELIRWGKTYLTATGNTPSQFNLLDILDEAIQSLDHLVRNKALVISRDIEDCALKINPEVLKFVLRNLLSNAVKFTSEGSIMVRGGKSGSEYELSVQDEGIGMPASVLKSLQTGKTFSRSGTKGEKGTGVGFILMANILKELHCDIRIKSKQGKGTMVTVLIPIKENNHSFASAVNQLS